jgi:spore photoproduct lyase
MNGISGFLENFVNFFEEINQKSRSKIMMEIRTKSAHIQPILDMGIVPQHTEFAFSLNPQSLIDKYEKKTSSLDQRIAAINQLLEK